MDSELGERREKGKNLTQRHGVHGGGKEEGQFEVARRGRKGKKEGRSMLRPYKEKEEKTRLFEFFGHYGELQLGLGERLHDDGLSGFRGGVA